MRFVSHLTITLLLISNVSNAQATRSLIPSSSVLPAATDIAADKARPAVNLRIGPNATTARQTLETAAFGSLGDGEWSILVHLESLRLKPDTSLLSLTNEAGSNWLDLHTTRDRKETGIEFFIQTDFKPEPLSVGVPAHVLALAKSKDILLRYRSFRIDLFCDGVLVDQEWPMGKLPIGQKSEIRISTPTGEASIWNSALSDSDIARMEGGDAAVVSRTEAMFGPEARWVQYSRPRGFKTHAGDAMPFYHDGVFHLFYLFDRRQHHSKWTLGAHQWAHMSSTDLVHWRHYPLAISIDHQWEGSICTGSVFFHDGKFIAFYATRLGDRSERLDMAESADAIHFRKTFSSRFPAPASPFIHGPNRDPFVFEANKHFHMLVTAAIANGKVPNEGALEHLVSDDLSNWVVEDQPFITSGAQDQPECSDLFMWGDWYYLVFSLSGTTHYRMSKTPLGPWIEPASDILDGPEAIVMKAAPFKNGRMLLVGFVQQDHQYGGDLLFRELTQGSDGALGTKIPGEMQLPIAAKRAIHPMRLRHEDVDARFVDIGNDVRFTANISADAQSTLRIQIGDELGDALTFDFGTGTVTWTDTAGNPARAKLEHVSDLAGHAVITLTLCNTMADLTINGHRTLIHRLSSSNHPRIYFSCKRGAVELSQLVVSSH